MMVDKAVLESLRGLYFGDLSNKYFTAIDRAYRDMNRTIRFKSMTKDNREKLRKGYFKQEKVIIKKLNN
ncbi:hypothetical protein [Eubacterium aggregans]|uniref:hypothetical protein n=1 Tax=Eubacterium aggregans TaxID=81409 RepID=UPI000B7D9478|nr:hypothetical protein [Eubacterium aggregans]